MTSTVVNSTISVSLSNPANPLNVNVSGPDENGMYELELYNPVLDQEIASLPMDATTFRALTSAMNTVLYAPTQYTELGGATGNATHP